MGYYASGDGYINFSRSLSKEEFGAVRELLLEEFEDVDTGMDFDYVSFWDSDKYHYDAVEKILEQIASEYPVSEGRLTYSGEDGEHWRFCYDPRGAQTESGKCWIEEGGIVVYDSELNKVYVLEQHWDCEANEGVKVDLFANKAAAKGVMRERADRIRLEYRELLGRDPWEEDYTWESENEIHLGFNPKGIYPFATVYSWRIYPSEVIK